MRTPMVETDHTEHLEALALHAAEAGEMIVTALELGDLDRALTRTTKLADLTYQLMAALRSRGAEPEPITSTQVDIVDLGRAFRATWSESTSSTPTMWTSTTPSVGQGPATALVVHDYYGGQIRHALVEGHDHFWNVLEDGTEIDFARCQYEAWVVPQTAPVDRAKLRMRVHRSYEELRNGVAAVLSQ